MAVKKSNKITSAVKKVMPGAAKKTGRQNTDVETTKGPATTKPASAKTSDSGETPKTAKSPSKTGQAGKTSKALGGAGSTPDTKKASAAKTAKVEKASKAAQSPGEKKATKVGTGKAGGGRATKTAGKSSTPITKAARAVKKTPKQ